jgi:hypothetical protein
VSSGFFPLFKIRLAVLLFFGVLFYLQQSYYLFVLHDFKNNSKLATTNLCTRTLEDDSSFEVRCVRSTCTLLRESRLRTQRRRNSSFFHLRAFWCIISCRFYLQNFVLPPTAKPATTRGSAQHELNDDGVDTISMATTDKNKPETINTSNNT